MDPQVPLRTIRRRWRPVAVLAVIGAVLGAASAAVIEDAAPGAVPVVRYDACHTLLVDEALPEGTSLWDVRNLSQLGERTTQGRIPENVAAATGRDRVAVSNHVRVVVRNDIRSLSICAVGKTPGEAEELADTYAAALVAVLESDAAEFHADSLVAARHRIVDAEGCVAAAQEDRSTVTETEDVMAETTGADQQVTLCQLQLIEARTHEINLNADGVPVVPLETLESADAVEISERSFEARVREGAAGTNVFNRQTETVGDDAPTSGRADASSSVPGHPAVRALLGFLLGAGLGAGWVHFTERLDSRLRRKDDVESTLDLPVLAEIPPLERGDRRDTRIISVAEPRSRSAESYRALRSALDYAAAVDEVSGRAPDGAQIVLVTSSGPSEGKTTTVANLAVMLAEGDRRVLAVNCDFRRPRLHQYLGGSVDPQCLNPTDVAGVQMVTQVTPSDADASPSDVVAAQRRLIEVTRSQFDVILLDTAPILTTNDAAELLGVTDHVILVISAGSTKANDAARAIELLERRGRPPLGVALVGTRDVPNSSEYYYTDDDPYLVASPKQRTRARELVGVRTD